MPFIDEIGLSGRRGSWARRACDNDGNRPTMWGQLVIIISRLQAASAGIISWRHYGRDFWLCALVLFLVEFGCAILGAPSLQILERAVCRKFDGTTSLGSSAGAGRPRNPDIPPPFDPCKADEVQVEFSILLTIISMLSLVASTAVQIPMGYLVDKKGRRLPLVLNITSTVLYWGWIAIVGTFQIFPIWCFYIAPVFILMGGGPWVTAALVFAAVHDRVTPLQRTTAFSMMEATSGIADLIGPLLGAVTMTIHLWVPFLISTILFSFMYFPAVLIGINTVVKDKGNAATLENQEERVAAEREPLLDSPISDADTTDPNRGDTNDIDNSNPEEARPSDVKTLFRTKFTLFAIGFTSILLFYLAKSSITYLIPWVSLRFNQSIAMGGLLFSLRAGVSMLLYFVLLPLASSWLITTRHLPASSKDLVLSLFGAIMSTVGSLLMAFAPNVPTLAVGLSAVVLGSGTTVTLRSFLASQVGTSLAGRLFAVISTIGTIGNLVGTPVMGALYVWGINAGLWAVALPFLGSATFFLLLATMLMHFKIKHV